MHFETKENHKGEELHRRDYNKRNYRSRSESLADGNPDTANRVEATICLSTPVKIYEWQRQQKSQRGEVNKEQRIDSLTEP